MRLYLDDCADDDELVSFLAQAGHEVHTPRGEQTKGLRDEDHLRYSADRGYTLITSNPSDFQDLHDLWLSEGWSHAGIFLICHDNIKGKDMRPADILGAVDTLLRSGLPIANEIYVLNHWR